MGERITPEQAATILGYSLGHVYRLLEQGRLPGSKWPTDSAKGAWELDREAVEEIRKKQDCNGRARWT
jgi:hypothetical protein